MRPKFDGKSLRQREIEARREVDAKVDALAERVAALEKRLAQLSSAE